MILGRLASSLAGGEGAPPLSESLTNLGVNVAALAVFGTLVARDLAARDKDTRITAREEELSRLLIQLGPRRQLPLLRFRGAVRPVIIAGDRSFVERCIREGEARQELLRSRGVSVVPVVYSSRDDPEEKLRALKRSMAGTGAGDTDDAPARRGFGSSGGGVGAASGAAASGGSDVLPSGAGIGNSEVSLTEADRKWRLEPAAAGEWEAWVEAQKEFSGMEKAKRNVWMQVQLDGTVRSSGAGTPPWDRFVQDLPALDSVRTQMTDGIGPSI